MSKLVGMPMRRGPELSAGELDEKRAADLARMGRFIARLQASAYFGKITIKIQNGRLVELCTEQVTKIDDL